jgi:hypothetical protein
MKALTLAQKSTILRLIGGIRKEFPQKFTESSVKSKPQQKVASAGRVAGNASSNKRQVKLSPSEVQMAKRLTYH